MEIVHRRDELLEVVPGLILVYGWARDDIVEKLSALCQLHHQKYVRRGLYDLVQFDHIRMVELGHDLNLALHLGLHLVLPNFLLAYHLNRHVEAGGLVDRLDNLSERPLTQRFEQCVVLQLQL